MQMGVTKMSLDKIVRGISVGTIGLGAAFTGGAALVDRASAKYQSRSQPGTRSLWSSSVASS